MPSAPDDATAEASGRAAPGAAPRVTVDQPETMNLLGLLLRSILERRLTDEAARKRAARLRGDLLVQGGRMRVTLRFADGHVTITRTTSKRPRARVAGTLTGFLAVARGGGIVRPLLRGELKAGGNLVWLLRILPLLRTA